MERITSDDASESVSENRTTNDEGLRQIFLTGRGPVKIFFKYSSWSQVLKST